jgi:hypothetical protein
MTDRNAVDQGYNTLRSLWEKTRLKTGEDSLPNVSYGFWHAGNTLDTFMDYLGRARPVGYQQTATTLGDQAVKIFVQVTKVDPTQYGLNQPIPTVAWWDDYGWWGIAFLKVHFLTNDSKYLHAAQVCWYFMKGGGRQYPVTSPGEKGGTWNHDPNSGGIQNVITNALFLTLSARLYNVTRSTPYVNEAIAQYLWFVYQLNNGAKVVIPGPFQAWLIHQLPLGDQQHFWTGDQGALLGGLSSLRDSVLSSNPPLAKELDPMCDALSQGMITSNQMVWPVSWKSGAKVVHEAEPNASDWRFDLNGSVGKGVLMRYLSAYWQKRYAFIENNAEAVARSLPGDGYFANSWIPDPNEQMQDGGNTDLGHLTRQCSGQDAMNAWLLPVAL